MSEHCLFGCLSSVAWSVLLAAAQVVECDGRSGSDVNVRLWSGSGE